MVEDLVEFDGVGGAVLSDGGAGLQRCARGCGGGGRGGHEGDVPFAEQGGGQQPGADVAGDLPEPVGVEGEGEPGAFAVGADLADPADHHAAEFDVGAHVQFVPGGAGLEGDGRLADEGLVVDGDADAGQQGGDEQEHHARGAAAGQAGAAGGVHPATRTVVVVPQMASERKKSVTLMMTIALRTERPTAMPTPAGPPLAW